MRLDQALTAANLAAIIYTGGIEMSANELKGKQTKGKWFFSAIRNHCDEYDAFLEPQGIYVPESLTDADAALIAEAGTVANETGMWPREMADALKDAEAALSALEGVQNGPPLEAWRGEWKEAMEKTYAALARIRAARGE
jgi:hypothetical protein